MRRGGLVLLVVALGAAIGLAIAAAADERDLAFTLGLVPLSVSARLEPGAEACQVPVVVEERFRAARFEMNPRSSRGVAVMTVRTLRGRRTLASGAVSGPATHSRPLVRLDREVPEDALVKVCIRNFGRGQLDLYGRSGAAKLASGVEIDGRPKPTDLTLVFLRGERRSVLSQIPEMFRRAALFRPAWVGEWTFWLLLVVVLCGVPLLLAAALRSAEDGQTADGRADEADLVRPLEGSPDGPARTAAERSGAER